MRVGPIGYCAVMFSVACVGGEAGPLEFDVRAARQQLGVAADRFAALMKDPGATPGAISDSFHAVSTALGRYSAIVHGSKARALRRASFRSA